ncbi:translesion error-prone DNA polymerase V autoproteolytic subunit [Ktedonosporobacter rubrisoli]|uniref:Translesion error-prone DNA polymerase V autoproteolytic subunit n=1 Tax=Ktedonosporobacter rubrisoli TaxID=2509675 RepID=A0A4P6JJ88_KTERU|nr:translesion error-prone DNA polymerase V autoproteolytic subunit [Ktedonosporobacter rubrisoli]QBD75177.1 translesion error-prone DNA polymerase V autoproteolytic subunit [Ktedonosporobacter rubrisoli]
MHKLSVARPLDTATLLKPVYSAPVLRPIFQVPAGYPSAAQDYMEQELDITNFMLGHRRASVFLFRIGGNSMIEAGIFNDDIIIVDSALEVQDGHIVVASVLGEYTCKYYRKVKNQVWLVPANPEFKPIKITEEMDFSIFGRYDGLIRKTQSRNTKPFKIPTLE